MSYDISLKQMVTEEKEIAEIGNYTYNVSPMYYEALGKSLTQFDGMKASEAIELLESGIKDMVNNSNEYRKMNPENGWGNYEGALQYLVKLLAGCKEFPDSIIEVS